jgi:hypothetical protein
MALITEKVDLDKLVNSAFMINGDTEEIINDLRKVNPNMQSYFNQPNSWTTFKLYSSVAIGGHVYFEIHTYSKYFKLLGLTIKSNGGPITATILESPSLTEGTNQVTCRNLHRTSTPDPEAVLFDNPTSITSGLPISMYKLYNNAGTKNATELKNSDWLERVFKLNTVYVLDILNGDTTTSDIFLSMAFIERNDLY